MEDLKQLTNDEIRAHIRELGMTKDKKLLTTLDKVVRFTKDKKLLWVCYHSYAMYYYENRDYKKAIYYSNKALKFGDLNEIIMSKWNLAENYYKLEANKSAKTYFKECADYFKSIDCFQYRAINIFNYARLEKFPEKHIKSIINIYQANINKRDAVVEQFAEIDEVIEEMSLYLVELYMRDNRLLEAVKFIKTLKSNELKHILKKKLTKL